jgi:hypothetical protein
MRAASGGAAALVRDLRLSLGGRLLCSVEGLESRAVSAQALLGGAAAGTAAPKGPRAAASAEDLAENEEILYQISWVADAPARHDDVDAAAALATAAKTAVVPAAAGARGAAASAADALQLLQGLVAAGAASSNTPPAGVQLRTRAVGPAGAPPGPAHAAVIGLREQAVWGMLRTAAQEAAGLAVTANHADPLGLALHSPASGFRLLAGPQQLRQFDGYGAADAGDTAYAPRMLRAEAGAAPPPHQLVPRPRGALGNLVPVAVNAESALRPGEVLLAVKAVGINFRDVLNVRRGVCACWRRLNHSSCRLQEGIALLVIGILYLLCS